jgi:hypothetical protein
VKIKIFKMANCLLLLTAQLMTAGELNVQLINEFHANIDVNDNTNLFWFWHKNIFQRNLSIVSFVD